MTVILALTASLGVGAKSYTLLSPDKQLRAEISDEGDLKFSLYKNNTIVVRPTLIGLILEDGTRVGSAACITGSKSAKIDGTVQAPFYRQNQIKDQCNELTLKLRGGFAVTFRAYDSGLAYRFSTTRKGLTVISSERADYSFDPQSKSWLAYTTNPEKPYQMAFQNIYDVTAVDTAKNMPAFLPVTVEMGSHKVTILESDIASYPNMWVRADGGKLKAEFAPYPKKMAYHPWRHMSYVAETEDYIASSRGARTYPWRILAVTDNDTEMAVNDLVYLLASPSRVKDTSWIKPGKVSWDWWADWNLRGVDFKAGINTDTYKYYIDFASKYHLPYVILDEGWYDSKSGDIMHPIQDVDLPQLISYGRSKGVGIVLWGVFNVLDENLENVCSHYADMGIKGFKVDFMDRDDQTAVEMVERLADCCARHHLILDLHGIYKPAGLNRTYPNILNFESVFGMEEVKWGQLKNDHPRYDVTFPFIRGMAGPVDFTPGALRNGTKNDWVASYDQPMSMGTRAHQAATYIVYDSPFTMLADTPTGYEQEPDYTKLLASLPDVFDETRALQGELGEYIITARRKGGDWYIGGMTNWTPRNIKLDLSFINNVDAANTTLLRDGINAGHNASDYKIEKVDIKGATANVDMASGGGFLMIIRAK